MIASDATLQQALTALLASVDGRIGVAGTDATHLLTLADVHAALRPAA